MPIDYSAIARAGGIGKGIPLAAQKAERLRKRQTIDERESEKVKARSGGRCEVVVDGRRCSRRAFEVHHLLGGHGVRGRGLSAKAAAKQHCCQVCHSAITSHRIQRIGSAVPHYTDRYRKVA